MEAEALETARNAAAQEWYEEMLSRYDIQSNQEVWLPLVPMEPAFEPLITDTGADEDLDIPTFSIGTQDEAEAAEPEAEEDLSTNSTEQDDSVFILDNAAESNG